MFAIKNKMGLIWKLSEELYVCACELLADADAKLLAQCERTLMVSSYCALGQVLPSIACH